MFVSDISMYIKDIGISVKKHMYALDEGTYSLPLSGNKQMYMLDKDIYVSYTYIYARQRYNK